MDSKTAALITLGCRLNQADSALMSDRLRRMGFEIVSPDVSFSPNLIIVNSCAVTAAAARKSRQALRSIRDENPQSFIVMTGCSAELDHDGLEKLTDCDLVLSNTQKKDLERILPRYLACLQPTKKPAEPAVSDTVFFERANSLFPFKTRAILKVQEGCENFCTYCIVPYARGRERSRDLEETLTDFRALADAGFKEIVLSGVNICNYNCGGVRLPELLERMASVDGDFRLRLSSTEPGPIVPELLRVMAAHPGKICAFLHLPLQHGSDEILQAMGRKYTTAEYAHNAELARQAIPDLHLGSDIIVGFPGETAAHFRASCDFLRRMAFANIHVFPYSPRPGTPAAKLPGCPSGEEMQERLLVMKELKHELAAGFASSLIGHTETILTEAKRPNGVLEGWSGNYVHTCFSAPEIEPNSLVRVRFRKALASMDTSLAADVLKD